MVDTMLTCDALHACDRLGISALVILSRDRDLMPCVLSAALRRTIRVHIGPARAFEAEREILGSIGAVLMDVSA